LRGVELAAAERIEHLAALPERERLVERGLALFQPLDDQLNENGRVQAAVDTVQAGPGDLVYLVGSREAALALEPWFVPVDAAIVGIVDDLHTPERTP